MLRKTVGDLIFRLLAEHASMRPQRNAAENLSLDTHGRIQEEASMRPQRNAAENILAGRDLDRCDGASMRPQRNAAENCQCGVPSRCGSGFNEAAA